MDASRFIAKRISFKGNIAMVSIAVSFLVMIIAVAVSSGFRHEIRDGVSSVSGDVQLVSAETGWGGEAVPVPMHPSYYGKLAEIPYIKDIEPVIYRGGIVKSGDNIHGVLFKGCRRDSLLSGLGVSVPARLAAKLGIAAGDDITAYFVGERVQVRKFHVVSLYDSILDSDENMVVRTSLADLQRLNGWDVGSVSALEFSLSPSFRSVDALEYAAADIGTVAMLYTSPEEPAVTASSAASRYPQLFDWLDLIDFNVLFILVLMTVVAGFNMISGLLIILFQNIPVIGILKSVGMKDRHIAKIFLSASSSVVLKGMAAGNAVALLLCWLQDITKILRLDPQNYFVSYVPVHIDLPLILAADLGAYAVIMLLLLIPSLFISGVDPARTVRVS